MGGFPPLSMVPKKTYSALAILICYARYNVNSLLNLICTSLTFLSFFSCYQSLHYLSIGAAGFEGGARASTGAWISHAEVELRMDHDLVVVGAWTIKVAGEMDGLGNGGACEILGLTNPRGARSSLGVA